MLGGTVYTFSLILAVFLVGLRISLAAPSRPYWRGVLVAAGAPCQWLLTAGLPWTAFMISSSLAYCPFVPSMWPCPWYTFQLDLVRCFWTILPAVGEFPPGGSRGLAAGPRSYQSAGSTRPTQSALHRWLVFSLLVVPAIGTAGSPIGADRAGGGGRADRAAAPGPEGDRWGAPGRSGGAGGRDGDGRRAGMERDTGAVDRRGVRPGGRQPGPASSAPEGPGDPDVFCTYVGEGIDAPSPSP